MGLAIRFVGFPARTIRTLANPFEAMGEIPSFDNMISAIITSPENIDDLQPDTAFDIKLQVNNLAAGAFTNPDITYYSAPQRLDDAGRIIGHVHVRLRCAANILGVSDRIMSRWRFKTLDRPTRDSPPILEFSGSSKASMTLATTMEV